MTGSRAAAGLRDLLLRLLELTRTNPILVLSLAAYVVAMLSYVFFLPDELRYAIDYDYGEPFFLFLTVLLFLRAAVIAHEPNIRLFWMLMSGGFGVWLAISFLPYVFPYPPSTQLAVVKDVLYFLHFIVTAVAIELRLDRRNRERGFQQHTAAAIGSSLLIIAIFGYFTILPLLASEQTYATPYLVHAALDAYFAIRFLLAAMQASNASWRRIFEAFFVVFALIVLADLLAWLYRLEVLDYQPGDARNLVWFLWYPVAMLLSAVQLDYPTVDAQYPEDTKLTVATRGALVFALALPFIHVVGYAFELFRIDARQSRDLFVGVWILLIAALLFGVYLVVRKKVVELFVQRTDAEIKVVQIEDQLNRELRIRSLGRLSAGLAHDFGNTLTAISMYAGIIREKNTTGEPVVEDINGLTESIGYAKDLVDKLSLFGNSGEQIMFRVLNFNEEVRRTVDIVSTSLPASIDLEFREGLADTHISAEAPMVHQVVTNYIYNAVDALRGDGSISVSVSEDRVQTQCASCGEKLDRTFAVLNVADTGPGVDESLLQHLFEPLVSTKPVGKGSGLGLSTVHMILHSIGGHVGLMTRAGGGASFAAYFPIAETAG